MWQRIFDLPGRVIRRLRGIMVVVPLLLLNGACQSSMLRDMSMTFRPHDYLTGEKANFHLDSRFFGNSGLRLNIKRDEFILRKKWKFSYPDSR